MNNVEKPIEIDVKSVKAVLDSGDDLVLLDCREPEEFELVRLRGARHIPMGEIPTRLDELNSIRDRRIVVYCHHGGRSLMVTEFLRRQGFNGAQNMSGGIDAWAVAIDTSLPRY